MCFGVSPHQSVMLCHHRHAWEVNAFELAGLGVTDNNNAAKTMVNATRDALNG